MNSLLQTAITAALQAGKAILDIYDDPASDFEIEHKADHSPLTIADRVSNEIILKQLKNTPYPVISEENKATAYAIRKQWQTVWIVDPLDGTKEFIKRNGEFTVNIALVYGGRPALGVIYIPVKKILRNDPKRSLSGRSSGIFPGYGFRRTGKSSPASASGPRRSGLYRCGFKIAHEFRYREFYR